MRIAVLADIHSNHIALDTCVKEALARDAEEFIFLGDYIGELACPQKTMESLRQIKESSPCTFIRGNKEDYWINRKLDEWSDENEYAPDKVSYGSNKMIIWNGRCGHTWTATAKNRGNGHGCPYCSGNRLMIGETDFASRYPEIASEWSDRNYPVTPTSIAPKSNKAFWWTCRRCGWEWQARVADRTDGHGCPVCSGEKLVAGINDLAFEHPELILEWSDRNKKRPDQVWSKSRENVWCAVRKRRTGYALRLESDCSVFFHPVPKLMITVYVSLFLITELIA